jgi:hypothetical protein
METSFMDSDIRHVINKALKNWKHLIIEKHGMVYKMINLQADDFIIIPRRQQNARVIKALITNIENLVQGRGLIHARKSKR